MTVEGVDSAFVFFCIVDGPAYLPKAITALRSVQRFHPTAGAVVVGRFGADAEAMAMIDRHGLQFEQLDLSHVFSDTIVTRRHPRVTWPSECFWWTAAPSMFSEKGYRFSCALDGDTLCVSPLELDGLFDESAAVAAVAKRNDRVNSGVLFFDNERLGELYSQAVRLYGSAKSCSHAGCTGFCRALGDQSLLHELEQRAGVRIKRLDNAYNHMLTWDENDYLDKNPSAPMTVAESKILHLLSKPWRRPPLVGRLNPVTCDGYRAWWEVARDIWQDPAERRSHFGKQYDVGTHPRLGRAFRRAGRSSRPGDARSDQIG